MLTVKCSVDWLVVILYLSNSCITNRVVSLLKYCEPKFLESLSNRNTERVSRITSSSSLQICFVCCIIKLWVEITFCFHFNVIIKRKDLGVVGLLGVFFVRRILHSKSFSRT
uniref:Uncharacterized protein n=1 Tax=Cacopsylla melanoneura TaxID=428564 RepID=A0A8D8ZMZ2_9HEMI